MTIKPLIFLLIFFCTISTCIAQTTTKKTYTKEEIEQLDATYKAKKKKDKAKRKELNQTTLTELTLEDINGNIYTLDDLKGKVVVMNFWFIRCQPCVAEIPDLNELKAKFKGKDVLFFAVALDTKPALEVFLESHPFDFIIIPKGGALANRFKIPHYPFNMIIDQNGTMQYVSDVLSLNIVNRLKRRINALLKEH
ncbi:TlpA disulfide reductase family protein [uncultured Psychroserpens sp.]|uniref:TlpA disulfide reductase family protein n=1 Tax=uncultured Psychroserpens sp. TaxID=255436 RepID=UPI002633B6EA|nr:TlpA disulfide reductase family protein [uncultured Psychroserpens sp.]